MAKTDLGACESCDRTFAYQLVHNGFNDSAFAYCDRCGREASLSCWYSNIPPAAHLKVHGPVNPEAEALLMPCQCGGAFRANASPRCPYCNTELSPEVAMLWSYDPIVSGIFMVGVYWAYRQINKAMLARVAKPKEGPATLSQPTQTQDKELPSS